MRVLVCGGRDYTDQAAVSKVLDAINYRGGGGGINVVISGAATGADTLGERWAQGHRVPIERYPADWDLHGKAAGPIRNKQMLVEGKPDLVIAFPGGRGTANMVEQAKRAGVPVKEIK